MVFFESWSWAGPSPAGIKVSGHARASATDSYGEALFGMIFFRRDYSALHAILVLLVLSATDVCAAAQTVPLPRPRPHVPVPPPWMLPPPAEPHSFRQAAGPDFDGKGISANPTDCNKRLEKIAAIELVPRLVGPGTCGGPDIVRLDAVLLAGGKRIDVNPAPHLRCPMAEQLALWLRDEAVPRVAATGAVLRSLEAYESFECRGRNRKMLGKVSEHGKANAVDLKGFTFADNRYFHLTDLMADKVLRTSIKESVCARFTTVLGPGSDSYHEEHIHLDLSERRNGFRICQWNVLEPPPPPPPKPELKPGETQEQKPEEAKPAEQAEMAPDAEEAEEDQAASPPIAGPIPLPRPRPGFLKRLKNRFL